MAAGGANRDQFRPIQERPNKVDVIQRGEGSITIVRMRRDRRGPVVVPAVESLPGTTTVLPGRPTS
jgi:hypothetical protein